jgi:hypothetical protein
VNRHLGVLSLVTVLAACASPALAPAPATPTLRDLATVDACTLLADADFAKGFTKPPEPLSSPLSCRWTAEENTVWMSVENESLEEAKARVNDGSELPVEGRKGWWGVTSDQRSQTSTGVVVTELSADRVLVVSAERTPPGYDIGMVARTKTVAILQKLVS